MIFPIYSAEPREYVRERNFRVYDQGRRSVKLEQEEFTSDKLRKQKSQINILA